MAVGTPCVASAAGGIFALARDDVDALLVQDGDPYAPAGAILRLVDDTALTRQLSQNALATALARRELSKARMSMLEICRSIVSDAGTAGAARVTAAPHEV